MVSFRQWLIYVIEVFGTRSTIVLVKSISAAYNVNWGDAVRIYFDNCCLNRPYDDLTDNTVRMECEAILSIIDNCRASDWLYFSSDVLLDEILEITDSNRREKVMLLYHAAAEHIGFTESIFARAKEVEQFNIKSSLIPGRYYFHITSHIYNPSS